MNRKDKFIKELIELYEKHNLCIGHEYDNGSFEICEYDEYLVEVIKDAKLSI